MSILLGRALALLIAGLVFVSPAIAQDVAAEPAHPKEAIVARYVNPQNFDGLYKNVLEQYMVMTPKKEQARALIEDEAFENQIFRIVQNRSVSSFNLNELQAIQRLADSPEGQSLMEKVNRLGMGIKGSDITPEEKQALEGFKMSPEGRSVAGKSVGFTSATLSEVMRTFLVRQAMANSLGQ